jgi:hypothetical protein
MRTLWCTLIAVCFIATGVRPLHGEHARGDAATVHVSVAKHLGSARRTAASTVGPLVAPAGTEIASPRPQITRVVTLPPSSPDLRVASSPRSSRGPPHV